MGNTLAWNLVVNDKSDSGFDSFESNMEGAQTKAKSAGKAIGVAFGAAGAVAGGLLVKGFSDNLDIGAGRAKLAGQLDLTAAESKKAGEAAGAVYADNWGASMDEVNEAIRSVGQNIGDVGDMSKEELTKVTEQALALSSTMGTDVALSTEAVGAMMKNGLAKNATEAFDIITTGMQDGTNKAGDLLETFQEYSPQFSKLGIEGADALALLNAGLEAGARDTDVIADAFKELSIRAIDGSVTTIDAYKSLGLEADKTAAAFGKGGESARQATQTVMENLLKIKDPVEQNRVGVELFGTQWEDTVQKILPALVNAETEIKNVDGATQRMSDTVGDTAAGRIETLKRKFEQWTQEMASSESALGLVVTAGGAFGASAVGMAGDLAGVAAAFKGTAAAEAVTTAATWVLNGALKALKAAWLLALGPVGLIVAGLALVAAGLIYAYKHCEKFRQVCNTVFKAVANLVLGLADTWLNAFQQMFNVMGKLPGKAGAPFRSAAKSVQGMRDKINGLRADINRVKGKTVTVRVNTINAVYGSKGGHYEGSTFVPARAAGGPVNAGQSYWVGENGPELFTPPWSGSILPNKARRDAERHARNAVRNRPGTVNARALAAAKLARATKAGDRGLDEVGMSSGSSGGSDYSGGGNTIINLIFNGKPLVTAREIREVVNQAFDLAPAGSRTPASERAKAAAKAAAKKGR